MTGPVPRSLSGPAQLAAMVLGELGDAPTANALFLLPAEPGLPGFFARRFSHAQFHYFDYHVYRQDVATKLPPEVKLAFSSRVECDTGPDLAVIFLPRSKDLVEYAFSEAARVVPAGASVLVVGHNKSGIRSCRPLVERYLGGVTDRRSARHSVLFTVVRDANQVAYDGNEEFALALPGRELRVVSLPGVFSHGELDPGTAFLLETLGVPEFDSALDWGCGAGVIGAALLCRHPGRRVDLADSHALALEAARKTLEVNDLAAGRVIATDGFSDLPALYDLIVTNPPFHTGRRAEFATTRRMIEEAPDHVTPSGRLVLVANTFINYMPSLRDGFGTVRVLGENNRYRVIEAREPRRPGNDP